MLSGAMAAHDFEGGPGLLGRDKGQQFAFVGDEQGIEAENA